MPEAPEARGDAAEEISSRQNAVLRSGGSRVGVGRLEVLFLGCHWVEICTVRHFFKTYIIHINSIRG